MQYGPNQALADSARLPAAFSSIGILLARDRIPQLTWLLFWGPIQFSLKSVERILYASRYLWPVFSAEPAWGLDVSLVLRTCSSGDIMRYQVGLLVHTVCCGWILTGLIHQKEEKLSMLYS